VTTRDYSAARPSTTAKDLERTVLIRIATGQYGIGQRMPTCTELGRELRANKNTVSKAYQALARQGYIVVSRGHGTFVAKQPRQVNATDVRDEVAKLIEYAVQHASRGGIEGDELYELVREVVDRVAGSPLLRVGFVTCNRPDATRSSSDLATLVGCPVEPLTLDDLADHAQLPSRFDLLGVDSAHQSSLTGELNRLREGRRPEVVPILSMPNPESILQVAALRSGTRLGIVADMPDTLHSLVNMARAFNAGLELRAATPDDTDGLREVLGSVDTILVTNSARQHIAELASDLPVIRVWFRIDGHSADALAERIAVLSRTRLALGRPTPSDDPRSPSDPTPSGDATPSGDPTSPSGRPDPHQSSPISPGVASTGRVPRVVEEA
jgi:DNA-binding transcriptional regulator YhcF (GntR family)